MLTSEQFKFHLARYAKVKEEDASVFMETVTRVLLEKIQAGEEVTIQGLGTFTVIDTQQGRRLGFLVDEKMRASVNAPFACFEPMVLASEMKKREPESEPESMPAEDGVEDVSVEPVGAAEEIAIELAETQENVESEIIVETEPMSEPQAVDVEPEPEESEEEPELGEPEVEEPVAEEPEEVASEPEEVVETEPEPENAPVVSAEPEKTPEAVAAPVQTPTPTRSRRPVEPTLGEQIMKYVQQVKEGKIEPWMWGVVAAVVVLILLICLLIPSGKKEKPVTPAIQPTVVEAPADTTQAVEDNSVEASAAVSKETAKKAEPARPVQSTKKGSKPTDDMLWMENGKPKTGQLGNGGRLTLLALRNYGDKAFWAYIYDVNAYQLGDPNNVPIGKPLYLPNPQYFGIDANDPASIKKAQVRAMQILREWE